MAEIQRNLFFTLPGELRNEIYSLVLAGQEKVVVSSLPGSENMENRTTRPQLSLLQVSRRMRQETLPVFYGWNTFQLLDAIKSLEAAYEWLSAVNPAHRALLRRVELPTFDMLSTIEGMRTRGFQLAKDLDVRDAKGFFAPKWLTFKHVPDA